MTKIRLVTHLGWIFGASVLMFATFVVSLQLAQGQALSGNCGMQLGGSVIFCEPFDVVNPGIPSRTGALDPNVWGVSRFTGSNFAVGSYNGWTATVPILLCDGTTPNVMPPNDVQICNGQLREATNDNPSGVFDAGTVLVLAMYPKQPFDFAGRTGTVALDVSNDSFGSHSAWPEFWVTDLPIPAPFGVHFFNSLPPNGFGVRMAGMAPAGVQGACPTNANVNMPRWTVDSSVVVRNYVWEDANFQGYAPGTVSNPPLTLTLNDCVIAPPPGSGILNHVEFRINTSQIEVWATDAGVVATPATLRKIATISNANLSFTRGLIWMEDAHYNADKGPAGLPSQRTHTFVWDNVAFDGPFTYRDFSYDALDALVVDAAMNTVDLGKFSNPGQGSSWNVLNMPANPQGTAARVMFNFFNQFLPNPTTINVTVNGHAHSVPWPYPDQTQNTWRTLAVTIPLTDLVAGTNVVTIGSDEAQVTSNVNIVLVDVPGGVPVLPGNSRTYPRGGGSPTAAHDFNGDGKSDVAWRDTSGNVAIWEVNGTAILNQNSSFVSNVAGQWTIVGQRDFNGDGYADLLWHDTSGNVAIWKMNGTSISNQNSSFVGNVPTNWSIVGVGDFNGDGMGDLLWQDMSGNFAIWEMNGTAVLNQNSSFVSHVPSQWSVKGTGDFNGDGKADILWQDTSGNVAIWEMNGTAILNQNSSFVANVASGWSIVGTGDFNGDGKTDIVWRDTAGDTSIWLMNGTTVLAVGGIVKVPTTFSIALVGDFNGDGMSDLLWQDNAGNTSIWLMSGTTIASTASVGNVPTTWTVQSVNAE
jgi:hypothetical protein